MQHAKFALIPLAALLMHPGAGLAGASMQEGADLLAPMLFLLGEWEGEGQSPYGPYEYDLSYTRRGGWIVAVTDIRLAPGRPALQNTAVLGVDEQGRPVSYAFEANGSVIVSKGEVEGNLIRFEWRKGEDWRRTLIVHQEDGSLRFEGIIHLSSPPPGVPADSKFESLARRKEQ